ncbi:hypothetical protein DPMN_134895 [Dreissena polymorpha]|uniref:Uncharacterized protein n=1 Tax=Dreissena polymorpha TaxID=45954 RepID=A0A9D4JG91_DREPO|nr:hypothetical protein DPMN_134895 [Dreissena polymorpha]
MATRSPVQMKLRAKTFIQITERSRAPWWMVQMNNQNRRRRFSFLYVARMSGQDKTAHVLTATQTNGDGDLYVILLMGGLRAELAQKIRTLVLLREPLPDARMPECHKAKRGNKHRTEMDSGVKVFIR